MPSGAIITTLGLAKLASATPLNQLNISTLAVGDGNGGYPVLDPSMTSLTNEVWRGTPSPPIRDPNSPNVLIFEAVIPPNVGGFTVREQAIFDEAGDMIAIGQTSVVEKPLPNDVTGVILTVRLHIQLDNAGQVDLFFQDDPTMSAANVKDTNGGSVQDHIDDYQVHTRTFANVDAMLAFNGLVAGQRYSTGITTWEYLGGGNAITDFLPLGQISITDYGARHSEYVDPFDCYAAIQQAIDDSRTLRVSLRVPSGTYYVSQMLVVRNDKVHTQFELVGDGMQLGGAIRAHPSISTNNRLEALLKVEMSDKIIVKDLILNADNRAQHVLLFESTASDFGAAFTSVINTIVMGICDGGYGIHGLSWVVNIQDCDIRGYGENSAADTEWSGTGVFTAGATNSCTIQDSWIRRLRYGINLGSGADEVNIERNAFDSIKTQVL